MVMSKLRPSPYGEDYLYVMQYIFHGALDDTVVKIGRSMFPATRRGTLQASQNFRVQLTASFQGWGKYEAAVHERLAHCHSKDGAEKEWFYMSGAQAIFQIESIIAELMATTLAVMVPAASLAPTVLAPTAQLAPTTVLAPDAQLASAVLAPRATSIITKAKRHVIKMSKHHTWPDTTVVPRDEAQKLRKLYRKFYTQALNKCSAAATKAQCYLRMEQLLEKVKLLIKTYSSTEPAPTNLSASTGVSGPSTDDAAADL
jgi:hypothetical protein